MYKLPLRIRILSLIFFAAAALATNVTHASIMGFGDFSGFSVNQSDGDSAPTVAPGLIHLTNQGTGEVRSIFSLAQQDISKFTASFTWRALGNPTNAPTFGACFVVQDRSAMVVADNAEGISTLFGYSNWSGVVAPSAAISLEYGHLSANSSSTGFYTDANVGNGALSTAPVNLFSGDPINATISYDGHTLTETLTDSVTSASTTNSFITNLPSILGASTAYVGFTADTVGNDGAQDFSNFQFTSGVVPEPSSILLLAGGALGLIAFLRHHTHRKHSVSSGPDWAA